VSALEAEEYADKDFNVKYADDAFKIIEKKALDSELHKIIDRIKGM